MIPVSARGLTLEFPASTFTQYSALEKVPDILLCREQKRAHLTYMIHMLKYKDFTDNPPQWNFPRGNLFALPSDWIFYSVFNASTHTTPPNTL